MVSIQDVADHAGVSSATVSRVLTDKPYVRTEVRERVMEAVDELGYQPNRVARSLRVQTSETIGLIISDIQNPFFTSIVRAVEDAAYEQGYSIFLCNSDEDQTKEQMYLDLLRAENVAGIIITATHEENNSFERILKAEIPIVALDRRIRTIEADTILLDNVDAAYRLVSHLIDDGHQRIATLLGPSDITTARERLEGYRKALLAHGIEPAPDLVTQIVPKSEQAYAATLEILELADPPTAIFAGNNLLTMGALRAIQAKNLRIPDEIAIAGFDEMEWAPLLNPGLTVIAQPKYELGRAAAELLLKRIEHPDRPTREVTLRGKLIVRDSCAYHSDAG